MKSSMTFIQSNGCTEKDLILKQKWRRFIWWQVSFNKEESMSIHSWTKFNLYNFLVYLSQPCMTGEIEERKLVLFWKWGRAQAPCPPPPPLLIRPWTFPFKSLFNFSTNIEQMQYLFPFLSFNFFFYSLFINYFFMIIHRLIYSFNSNRISSIPCS